VQVAPQLMPLGFDVTVPLPVPARLMVSVFWASTKLAVTVVAAVIVTTQVPVPVQLPPDHPVNSDPDAGLAVNVTLVP
jgi:hypothetical protein